jgi:hypothetical protein
LDSGIEAGVPALDLLRRVFFAEALDDLTYSRRVLQESGAEVAPFAAGLDRDRAVFLKVPIPLGTGSVYGSSQRVFSSKTNHTGMVIERPVRRPMTVMEIWRRFLSASVKASSAIDFVPACIIALSILRRAGVGLG